MTVFQQIFIVFLVTTCCEADFQTDCSAMSDSYYIDGICYVAEQYNTHLSLSSSCQSLNSYGKLIDVHIAETLANVSRTLYDPNKGGSTLPIVGFNGYKLKVGDEIRIIGRFLTGLTHGAISFINSGDIINGDIPIIVEMELVPHDVFCWSRKGGILQYDTKTNDPTHIRNEVNNDHFDLKLKITANGYELYYDDVLVHTCPQNQTYQDISEITGWGTAGSLVTHLVTINGEIYGGQKYFWSSLSKQSGKWMWANNGLPLKGNYAGWTDGHPTEESNKKCALIDGNTGRLLTANCNQRAAAICQYSEQPGPDPQYTFSKDVIDKKVSASSFLAEFTTRSSIVCLVKCGQVSTCKSVAYNKDSGHCQLHDIYSGQDTIDATGYEIYNRIYKK